MASSTAGLSGGSADRGTTAPNSAVARPQERFPRVPVEELDEDGLALRDAMLAGPRNSAPGQFPIEAADSTLEGPFGLFLFAPAIGAPLQELGARLRSHSSLTSRRRELATLAVTAELGCQFELRAHIPLALNAGIAADEISQVLDGRMLADATENAIVSFCRANAREVTPQDEFDQMTQHCDRQAVFEVTALVAYYRGLASMLNLFRIEWSHQPLPAGIALPPSGSRTTPDQHSLALLLDEREISRVLTALARCVDTFDFEGLAELYAEDGELVTPGGSHKGRDGLADHARRDIGSYKALHHVSAGHEIYVVPGEAVARARMTLLSTHVTDDGGRVFTTVGGHYDIQLVRENGAWRLQRNTIVPAWTLDWCGGPGAVPEELTKGEDPCSR